jgi:transcriptional regulator
MFVRPCWKPWDTEAAYELVATNPWALLVHNGAEGPLATNLPLMLDRSRGPLGVLVGHIARANDHARALAAATGPVLAVFEGPVSFVSASWYPNRDMPGTYYYTAVHFYGHVRIQPDAEVEAALGALNDRMEGTVPNGWKMDEIPHSEVTRRLPAIVGFEIEVERMEAKFKIGQDEPRKDALAVAERLAAATDSGSRALAELVRRANTGRPSEEAP